MKYSNKGFDTMYKDDIKEIFRLKAESEEKTKNLKNTIKEKLEDFKMKFEISMDFEIELFKNLDSEGILLNLHITQGYTITNDFIKEITNIMQTDSYNIVFDENKIIMTFLY